MKLILAILVLSAAAFAQSASSNVTLNWTASTTSGVTAYNIYRAATACSTNPTLLKISSTLGTATTFTDSGVAQGAIYCYAVSAVGPNGLESDPTKAEVTVFLIPPAPPTNVTATVH